MTIFKKVKNWFLGKYFQLLLKLDEYDSSTNNSHDHDSFGIGYNNKTNIELNNIVINIQKIAYREGIGNIKNHVNSIIKAKTPEEYNRVLTEIGDLMEYAKAPGTELDILKKNLYNLHIKTGGKDIKSNKDKAKMINKRIEDFNELKSHKKKRQLLRDIRQAKVNGDTDLHEKLQKQWREYNG